MTKEIPAGSIPPVTPAAVSPRYEDDTLDLRDLVGVLMRGRWLLVGALLAALGLGVAYVLLATPIYKADALVQVEKGQKSLDALLGVGQAFPMFADQSMAAAEIEIIRSRLVVGEVVRALGLDISAGPRYFPLVGQAVARFRTSPTHELAAPLFGLGRYAWGGERIDVSRLEVPPDLVEKPLELDAAPDKYILRGPDGVELLRGKVGENSSARTETGAVDIFVRDLAAHPGTRFRLMRRATVKVIERLQKDLRIVEKGRQSGILQISLEGPDAPGVVEVVNHLVTTYQRQNVERKSQEAKQTLDFLQVQLPKVKAQVEAAEEALNQYRLKRGSADLSKETELILQQSIKLETARLELQQRREEATKRFMPNHPVVQAIDDQLKSIGTEAARINAQVQKLPETQQEILRLKRDLEVSTQLYTALLNKAQELEVAKAGTIGNVRIIDLAVIPPEPTKPKAALSLALLAVLGVFLGVVAVFTRRALHAGVEDPAEVERHTGLTAYACIPYAEEQHRIERRARRQSAVALLAASDAENVAVESLRSLRTALHFGMVDASNNIISLTGAEPGVGKTFVATNLGAVLAQSGKKVLVVDMDLRRGRLHRYLGGNRSPGLTEYISQADDRIIRKTGVQGLDAITTGTLPPNPAELIMNERTPQLLRALSQQYDFVIVDTPPILAVTDAALVGRIAGTTLLVLKAGKHPMRMIEDAVRRLQQAGVAVRGTIFNQVGVGGTVGYGYRYGYAPTYYSYKRSRA